MDFNGEQCVWWRSFLKSRALFDVKNYGRKLASKVSAIYFEQCSASCAVPFFRWASSRKGKRCTVIANDIRDCHLTIVQWEARAGRNGRSPGQGLGKCDIWAFKEIVVD